MLGRRQVRGYGRVGIRAVPVLGRRARMRGGRRHYRPNHHGSSQRIYESIEAVEKHASGQGVVTRRRFVR